MEEILTANARAVLNVLRESERHPTAQEVYDRVRLTRPRIGLATVYRILGQLERQGMIKVWGYGSERARYDARTHRHDHAYCTTCGVLLDIPVEIVLPRETLEQAARAAGIVMGSHEIRMYGQCRACQARSNV